MFQLMFIEIFIESEDEIECFLHLVSKWKLIRKEALDRGRAHDVLSTLYFGRKKVATSTT